MAVAVQIWLQAGGKEPAKLVEALKAGGEALTSMLQ